MGPGAGVIPPFPGATAIALLCMHDFAENSSDAAEMAKLNRAFHEAICRAARNRYLDNVTRELQE